jgi:hypothetical protein
MLTHFDMASNLREAALRGDLTGVRRAAARLADLERPPDLGPDLAPSALACGARGRAGVAHVLRVRNRAAGSGSPGVRASRGGSFLSYDRNASLPTARVW